MRLDDEDRSKRSALRAARARITDCGGGEIRWWVTEPTADDAVIAAEVGLIPERELRQLRRPLPIGEPTGIAVRPFVFRTDAQRWLAVNNRAFADHPDQGGWTADMLQQRLDEPWFDPAAFLLHEDAASGRLAGFVWAKVHDDSEPRLGEIFVIGVDPDFGGRGLGRRLAVAGLDWLWRRRGINIAMLYVDAANARAVSLYTNLGFSVHHVDGAFVGRW